MNEQDERYSTAEDAIFDAFFLLLREKDLEKITVSDVIKKPVSYAVLSIIIMRISRR